MLYGNDDILEIFDIVKHNAWMKHMILIINGFHKEKMCNWCIFVHGRKTYKE